MRLIDLRPNQQEVPADLAVALGDVLRFAASGGRVREGEAVELVGVFSTAAVGLDGNLLTPAGAPDVVLFRAVRPGQATLEVMSGDPFHSAQAVTMTLSVT
jgi:hypothetical protein